MAEVTVCVATYFGNQMYANCIASLLTVVKGARILTYKNDVGWLKACNEMMQSVTTDVILLNDDTFILTDIVEEMRTLAYSDEKIGIVGGKALAPDAETIINYGIYISPDGNTAHKYYGQSRDSVQVEKQSAVEGSCIYIKREVLDKVGYFDENYGMGYREEVDLQFRAREAGYEIYSCPTAEYIHLVSQTNPKLNVHNDTYDYFMSKWGRKLTLGLL